MPHDPIVPSKRAGKRVWLLVVGKRHYEHPTYADAVRQRTAIALSKARARGYDVPPKRPARR